MKYIVVFSVEVSNGNRKCSSLFYLTAGVLQRLLFIHPPLYYV